MHIWLSTIDTWNWHRSVWNNLVYCINMYIIFVKQPKEGKKHTVSFSERSSTETNCPCSEITPFNSPTTLNTTACCFWDPSGWRYTCIWFARTHVRACSRTASHIFVDMPLPSIWVTYTIKFAGLILPGEYNIIHVTSCGLLVLEVLVSSWMFFPNENTFTRYYLVYFNILLSSIVWFVDSFYFIFMHSETLLQCWYILKKMRAKVIGETPFWALQGHDSIK